jgi:molecular chaperone GrpE
MTDERAEQAADQDVVEEVEGEVVEDLAELEAMEAAASATVEVVEGEAIPATEVEVDELAALQEQLAEAEAKAQEYLDGWQRARAEFVNYRRREETRRQQMDTEVRAGMLVQLLPVVDDMDRAFEAIPEDVCGSPWVNGLRLVERKLHIALEKVGLAAMETAPGDTFDPNYHEAIMHEPSEEFEAGQVIGVLQRGFKVNDMVLRPALVRVSSGKLEQMETEDEGTER